MSRDGSIVVYSFGEEGQVALLAKGDKKPKKTWRACPDSQCRWGLPRRHMQWQHCGVVNELDSFESSAWERSRQIALRGFPL
jgi:hypothetical protein